MSSALAPTDAARIAADGLWLTLGGVPRRLHFGMRATMYIEKEFGSLDDFVAELSRNKATAICGGIVAALLHEKSPQMAVEAFQEEIVDLLDGASLSDLARSLVGAVSEALPPPKPGEAAPKGAGSRGRSRGRGTTSWPRSATAARRPSSSR